MPLAPLFGHDRVRSRISRAIARNQLPQVLLFTGPTGVGKQRLALWAARRLLCTALSGDEPCGRCPACLKVLNLGHPDVHWLVPIPRPKAGEPDKQVEEVAESLEAIMAERRASPLWQTPEGTANHGIASARWLQRHAVLTAAEGGWRVFIIGNAERLVPQESSPEAANALLKLLEEPPPRALFVLTTAEPGLVLPTIRSRAVPLRIGRVSDADVERFLRDHAPARATAEVVKAARGVIGDALAGTDATRDKAARAAREFLEALRGGDAPAMARVLRQGTWAARGDFTELLDALAELLARDTRRRVGKGTPADDTLAAIARVLEARDRAQGNINPQLLLATLADELEALVAA